MFVIKEDHYRFIRFFLATWIGLLGVTIVLNFIVDPAQIFHKRYEQGIAKILASGKNVAGVGNFDERSLQIYRADVENRHFDWVVVGSSRALQITHSMVGGTLINMAISGACLEDEIALLSLADRKFSPTNVVIEVDPWIFNENNGVIAWVELANQYIDGIGAISSESRNSDLLAEAANARSLNRAQMKEKILQLINAEYTWASWRAMSSRADEYAPQESDIPPVDAGLIRVDGSRLYSQKYAGKNTLEVGRMAQQYAHPPVYLLEGSDRLSERHKMRFELELDYLRKRRKVIILLAPYHPVTFGLIAPKYRIISEVEEYLRSVAAAKGIKVIGSYDPEAAQCNETEFYDAMHPKASCIARILAGREKG